MIEIDAAFHFDKIHIKPSVTQTRSHTHAANPRCERSCCGTDMDPDQSDNRHWATGSRGKP